MLACAAGVDSPPSVAITAEVFVLSQAVCSRRAWERDEAGNGAASGPLKPLRTDGGKPALTDGGKPWDRAGPASRSTRRTEPWAQDGAILADHGGTLARLDPGTWEIHCTVAPRGLQQTYVASDGRNLANILQMICDQALKRYSIYIPRV